MSFWRVRTSYLTALVAVGLGGVAGGCGLVVGASDYLVGDAGTNESDSASRTDAGMVTNADGSHEVDVDVALDAAAPNDALGALESGPLEVGTQEADTPETGTFESGAGDGSTPFLACASDGGALPQAFPSGSPALQQLVLACVIAETCDPLFFDVPLAACITNNHLQAIPSLACLATAKSCADYYTCQGQRIADDTECSSSASNDTGTCVNGVARSCSLFGGGAVWNCNVLGGTCTVYPTDDSGDTAAGCKILSSCPNTNDGSQCESATQRYSCETTQTDTIAIGQNCPQSSTCRTSTGGTHCYASGPACTTPTASCSGGDLSGCVALPSGNQSLTYKCSVGGLSCVTNGDGGTGSCVTPGCEHSHCVDSCDDDGVTLHTCIGGAQYDVDCTMLGLGFVGCSQSAPSGSSTLYTYCSY